MSLLGCGGNTVSVTDSSRSTSEWDWASDAGLPAHFPLPAVPEDNPMSRSKVELGRFLFYDVRLSGNGTQACASCHLQSKAFSDGRPTALGSTGESHPRNSQTLGNVAYNATLTWANPALTTLERQMETPLFGEHPVEMGINNSNQSVILDRLASDSAYQVMFKAAYPGDTAAYTWKNVTQAIASFQRSLITANSRYDQWLQGKARLNEQEIRGMNLFSSEKAECFHCHSDFNFNDQVRHASIRVVLTPFHNTGLYNIDGAGGFPAPNRGVFELTSKANDMGKFRAPSLRNVEVSAPYMHDGSVGTLEEVLDFYAAGGRHITSGPYAGDGRTNPLKSDLIARINLTDQDKADLVAFLKTLTDHEFLNNNKLANPFASP